MPQRHLKDPLFVARPDAARMLMNSFLIGGSHARAIYDARRMGKTTFLQQDLTTLAEENGFLVIYHSFYASEGEQVQSFLVEIASRAPASFTKRIFNWFKRKRSGLTVSAGIPSGVGASFAPFSSDAPEETQTQLLSELISALLKKHPKVLFILDEFQELAKGKPAIVRENAGFIRNLRTVLDTNKGSIKTVFAGSNEDLLKQLFQNHVLPFYGFAGSFELPRFNTDFAEEIGRRLMRQNARRITPDIVEFLCPVFVEKFERSPERARLFFQKIQESDLTCEEATAAVLAELPTTTNYDRMFEAFSGLQKAILKILATGTGKGIFGKTAKAQINAETQIVVTPSMLQNALKSLCGKSRIGNEVIISGEPTLASAPGGGYYFIDTRFGEWVKANSR